MGDGEGEEASRGKSSSRPFDNSLWFVADAHSRGTPSPPLLSLSSASFPSGKTCPLRAMRPTDLVSSSAARRGVCNTFSAYQPTVHPRPSKTWSPLAWRTYSVPSVMKVSTSVSALLQLATTSTHLSAGDVLICRVMTASSLGGGISL